MQAQILRLNNAEAMEWIGLETAAYVNYVIIIKDVVHQRKPGCSWWQFHLTQINLNIWL